MKPDSVHACIGDRSRSDMATPECEAWVPAEAVKVDSDETIVQLWYQTLIKTYNRR